MNQLSLDVRIFIPKDHIRYSFYNWMANQFPDHREYWRNRKIIFAIKNINLIAGQGTTKRLTFQVAPNPQGLVGLCYQNKKFVGDNELAETNETLYDLDEIQKNLTKDLEWAFCSPILDSHNNVIAIMSFDGKTKIELNKESEKAITGQMMAFADMLYDSVPQLFGR